MLVQDFSNISYGSLLFFSKTQNLKPSLRASLIFQVFKTLSRNNLIFMSASNEISMRHILFFFMKTLKFYTSNISPEIEA